MNAKTLVEIFQKSGVPFELLQVKAIVVMPDDPKMMIEMQFVQALDGMDNSIVLQLEAKGEIIPNVNPRP